MLLGLSRQWMLTVALAVTLTGCHGINFTGSSSTSGGVSASVRTFEYASGVLGQPDFVSNQINQGFGHPTANTLNTPVGRPGGASGGLFYDPDQGNNRVLAYTGPPTGNSESPTYVLGQVDFLSSTPGTSDLTLDAPRDVSVYNGQLFVADTGNNRVLVWNMLPQSNQMPAKWVEGQPDFQSNTGATDQATFKAPDSVVAAGGKLFVADSGNNRVLIYNTLPTKDGVNADVVIGQANFTDNGAGISASRLNDPEGIWSDGKRLVIADTGNNRVLIYNSIPTQNNASADVVVGQPGFNDNSAAATRNTLNHPEGVFASSGQLIVADTGNNRVLVFNTFPTASQPDADEVLGQDSFTAHTANDYNQDGIADGAPTARTLKSPTAVYVAANQSLYVTDNGNNRVLVFAP